MTTDMFSYNFSAGCLPMCIIKGKPYFLLGMDRNDSTWSDFGGRCEDVDNDEPKRTAAREFYEETSGCIMDTESMTKRLNDDGCHVVLRSRTMGGNEYYMYVVSIPYMNHYQNSFNSAAKFLRYIKANRKYVEKSSIGWFAVDEVIKAAKNRGSGARFQLRGVFASSVAAHEEALERIEEVITHRYPSPNRYYADGVAPKKKDE